MKEITLNDSEICIWYNYNNNYYYFFVEVFGLIVLGLTDDILGFVEVIVFDGFGLVVKIGVLYTF